VAPLGREVAGDTLLPPAQAEQSTLPPAPAGQSTLPPAPAGQSETSPASTGGILMQSPASAVQWLDQSNPAAAVERDTSDAPVAEERVATEPQATDAADAAPPQPAAIETAESTGLTPQWMFLVIAAALAISGIVVPFKIAAARRRRIRIDGYRTAPPAPPTSKRIPPRFDDPTAAGRRPSAEDEETLRQILRSRDRRAA
jgi:hypothetical protein